jgi:hypothetical protein
MTPNQVISVLTTQRGKLKWRAHGIGFIKAYLDEERTQRINIYHDIFKVPNISLHHDHPWELRSTIVAGQLTNTRYEIVERGSELYRCGIINCANFRGLEGEVGTVALRARGEEVYGPGSRYRQLPDEIHATTAVNGTVTIMERTDFTPEGTARIFWPDGSEWVDATRALDAGEVAARGESSGEVAHAVRAALIELGAIE